LSVLIIYKLRQKQNNLKDRRSTNNSTIIDNEIRLSKQKLINQGIQIRSTQKTKVIRSRHRHITLMLLAISAVFLLLTLPNSIYFVLEITYNFNQPPTDNNYFHWLRYRRLTILTVIMFQISDLQHATNFFLYVLTSDKFRRSVLGICQSMIRILPIRGCDRIERDKNRYGTSCDSNVSDIIQNSRYKSNQRQDRYQSILSKSITTTTKID
jgi:hypothetical protein